MVWLVTDLGDAALVLPASAALFVYLAYAKSLRAAVGWAAALMLCIGLTIAAKMVCHACGGQVQAFAIRSPSGHVALGTTFYGAAALIFSLGRGRLVRLMVLLGCAAVIVAIAVSRVVLHSHTIAEVVAGLLIGVLCLAGYAAGNLPRLASPPGWQIPAAMLVVLAFSTHGHHLSLEIALDRLTDRVQLSQHLCPVNDGDVERTVETDAPPGS